MKAFPFSSGKDKDLAAALAGCRAIDPQIVLLFAASPLLEQPDVAQAVKGAGFPVVGCSTAGEISEGGVSDLSFSGLALHFDKVPLKFVKAPLKDRADSRRAGEELARQLAAADLTSVFALCPGSFSESAEFAKGLTSGLASRVLITGGIAGRHGMTGSTYTFLNDVFPDNHAVAVGFYGDSVRVKSGSCGGWKPFGPVRRVTKAEGGTIYELDGKPALQLYKEYLGPKAAGLPYSGLMFPFAILSEENRQDTGIIRTLMDVDHAANTMTMAASVPQGSLVRMMHADNEALVDAARKAAEDANAGPGEKANILVSCAGRKILMGSDVDEEIDAVLDVIGRKSAFTGFYSYGEICPYALSGSSELHHQTMTITSIYEEKAA
ncbi:MAG: FIST signal transduction protein [Alphaproteobacteria bacterium]